MNWSRKWWIFAFAHSSESHALGIVTEWSDAGRSIWVNVCGRLWIRSSFLPARGLPRE